MHGSLAIVPDTGCDLGDAACADAFAHAMQAQEEVDRILGSGDKPSLEQYTSLKYVLRCVSESMRLYPPPARAAQTSPGA